MNANWSDYERFLKPVHLDGQAVTLTIVKATEEETHPQKGKTVVSPVLWFRENPFGLILSPTNRATLIALYGDAIAGCLGKPITLQAVAVKVAGNDKQPIRILRQRPAAPHVETDTGEMVDSPLPIPDSHSSELDEHFGSPKLTAGFVPGITMIEILPDTEAKFAGWLKHKGWNGQETYRALGADAKTWMKNNPGTTWADVCRAVEAAVETLHATSPQHATSGNATP